MTGALRAELVSLADMPSRRAAWDDLVARCLEPCVFMEPSFALPAAHAFAPVRGLVFVLVWSASAPGRERLVGLCPMVGRRGRWHVSALSHAQATAAFPLLDRDEAEAGLEALLRAIAGLPTRPPALLLEGLPVEGPTAQLIGTIRPGLVRSLDPRTRAVLRVGQPATRLSAKARKELRRQFRRLADRGRIDHTVARTREAIDLALGAFLALEAAGWKGRRGTALGQNARLHGFTEAVIGALAASGQCWVESLALEGTPVAAGIVLRSREHAWFWKIAYAEDHARRSPGVQLALALTETLQADPSLTLVDSCAIAGHPLIDRVWSGRMIVDDVLVATGRHPTLAFTAVAAALAGYRRIRGGAKRLRERFRRVRAGFRKTP